MKLRTVIARSVLVSTCGLSARLISNAQVAPPPVAASAGAPPVISRGVDVNFNGSVSEGTASADPLRLTLRDAIARGLRYNLGILTSGDVVDLVSSQRRRALSALLPNLTTGATQNSAQNNLVAFGLQVPGFPQIVGPFSYQNARAYAQQTVYDRPALKTLRSADESLRAARLSAEDARNLVVQAVSNSYLAVITSAARVDAIQAEVATAQALFERASDQKRAGTVPGIDVLRAEVQLRGEEQRLLAQRNAVEKDKLALARAIGLPAGQQFSLSDVLPFAPVDASIEDMLKQAFEHRPDLKAAQANLRAAELALESAHSEHWPSLVVEGDYGVLGRTLAESHGTYSIVAGVRIPIYAGGRSRSNVEQADAVVRNRRNALDDLRGRIDFEIRGALLDLRSAADQVSVARRNIDLAGQTVTQARDRFSAGVTDNIEVVQAQQALALANDNYISSLAAHNAAKIALATALGIAEEGVPRYMNLPQ